MKPLFVYFLGLRGHDLARKPSPVRSGYKNLEASLLHSRTPDQWSLCEGFVVFLKLTLQMFSDIAVYNHRVCFYCFVFM